MQTSMSTSPYMSIRETRPSQTKFWIYKYALMRHNEALMHLMLLCLKMTEAAYVAGAIKEKRNDGNELGRCTFFSCSCQK